MGDGEGIRWLRFAPLGARASRPQSRAVARRALTLALSHEGRGDPPASVRAWFRAAGLIRQLLRVQRCAAQQQQWHSGLYRTGGGGAGGGGGFLMSLPLYHLPLIFIHSRLSGGSVATLTMRLSPLGRRSGSAMRLATGARRPVPAGRGRRSRGWRRSYDGTRFDLPAVYLYPFSLAGRRVWSFRHLLLSGFFMLAFVQKFDDYHFGSRHDHLGNLRLRDWVVS